MRARDGQKMTVDVAAQVITIIAQQAQIDLKDVHIESRLDGLGFNSLALVEMIFALEDAFDISVPFNANTPEKPDFDMSSVAAIIAAVDGFITQKLKCTA